MNEYDSYPSWRRDQDESHLRLLSIFHYVAAGLSLLGALFLFFHYLMFQRFFSTPEIQLPDMSDTWQQGHGPPDEFFTMIIWFYVFAGALTLGAGLLNLLSGLFIAARKHRTFSIFVAVLNCLQMPVGTILGVFTIVVLMRDSVRDLYDIELEESAGRWER